MKKLILFSAILMMSICKVNAQSMVTQRITDWNNIWQNGFYESVGDMANVPISSRWCWGINIAYARNNENDKENCQIIIIDQPYNPKMFFRNTDEKGAGAWAEVINNLGNQNIKGDFTIAGKIFTREIQVTVNAGADHVFNPEYNLKDLSEVKNFVEENKHLPDIPSESQMLKEGLNVNEFQIKLLQKIEELTLYTIRQQELINELKKDMNSMSSEIKELKSNN